MKATAELKMLPVSVLKPAAYNPRKKLKPGDKEYEKIKNSITEFGFADPLVVNANMTIIGGHQRLTVAMELGYTEVPCAVVDIDKTREKALNIALNKITGAWDDSLLADLLKDIEDSNFDLGKTGFEPPEIETLFNKVHSKEVKEDDFDVESELKQPCFSKEGDLWHLGKHIVLCGDSTKAECYDTLMDGVKANLVLSDPPYNVDVEETAGKILNDNMGDSEFYQFLLAAFQQMHGHLADDGSIYIFHADTEGLNFRKAFKDAGFYLSGCCIWKKNALVLGRSPYQWQHEPCLYAYDHFAEGESPDPPFICFLYPKAENFGADNLVYHHFNRLDIEVYTDYKDPDMEATIEEVLTAHELYYEKSEVWIETEKMYEVLYELTV